MEQQATQILEERRLLREELERARSTDNHQVVKEVVLDNSKEIQEVELTACYCWVTWGVPKIFAINLSQVIKHIRCNAILILKFNPQYKNVHAIIN